MRRRVIARVREHPFGFLSGFVSICLEVTAVWLLSVDQGHHAVDFHKLALGLAIGMLGYTFWILMLGIMIWSLPLQASELQGSEPGRAASSVGVPRMIRPSRRVRIFAYMAWGVLLVLALAQVAIVSTGDQGQAVLGGILGYVVLILNFVEFIGVFMVRFSSVQRYV